MAVASAIIAGVGVASSAAATAVQISNSNAAAKQSQDLMAQQNGEQQQVLDNEKKAQDQQQQQENQQAQLQANRNAAAMMANRTGRTPTILTSPLAPLAGTRGVGTPAPMGAPIGSLGTSTMGIGGSKTLLGS